MADNDTLSQEDEHNAKALASSYANTFKDAHLKLPFNQNFRQHFYRAFFFIKDPDLQRRALYALDKHALEAFQESLMRRTPADGFQEAIELVTDVLEKDIDNLEEVFLDTLSVAEQVELIKGAPSALLAVPPFTPRDNKGPADIESHIEFNTLTGHYEVKWSKEYRHIPADADLETYDLEKAGVTALSRADLMSLASKALNEEGTIRKFIYNKVYEYVFKQLRAQYTPTKSALKLG